MYWQVDNVNIFFFLLTSKVHLWLKAESHNSVFNSWVVKTTGHLNKHFNFFQVEMALFGL